MVPQLNPLTDEHCTGCNKILQAIEMQLELARACKDCGLDVDAIINTLNEQKHMAQRIKANFFPHQP